MLPALSWGSTGWMLIPYSCTLTLLLLVSLLRLLQLPGVDYSGHRHRVPRRGGCGGTGHRGVLHIRHVGVERAIVPGPLHVVQQLSATRRLADVVLVHDLCELAGHRHGQSRARVSVGHTVAVCLVHAGGGGDREGDVRPGGVVGEGGVQRHGSAGCPVHLLGGGVRHRGWDWGRLVVLRHRRIWYLLRPLRGRGHNSDLRDLRSIGRSYGDAVNLLVCMRGAALRVPCSSRGCTSGVVGLEVLGLGTPLLGCRLLRLASPAPTAVALSGPATRALLGGHLARVRVRVAVALLVIVLRVVYICIIYMYYMYYIQQS